VDLITITPQHALYTNHRLADISRANVYSMLGNGWQPPLIQCQNKTYGTVFCQQLRVPNVRMVVITQPKPPYYQPITNSLPTNLHLPLH